MSSFTKIVPWFLPFGIVLFTTIYYSPDNSIESHLHYTDRAEENEDRVLRHRRAFKPTIRHCRFSQYYDREEGRCLGVPGGGKALHVNNERLCGINVLKPHCTNTQYYYVCKRDKSILAQCANGQFFNNRLRRCLYDWKKLNPSKVESNKHHDDRDQILAPPCSIPGRFPVLGRCSMFYACDIKGHRLVQSVFKCPRNTRYQPNQEICVIASDCDDDDSVESTICVPDASDEAVESPNVEETSEENIGGVSETFAESNTAATNDPDVSQSDSTTEEIAHVSASSVDTSQIYSTTRSFESSEIDETLTPSQEPTNSARGIPEEIQNESVPSLLDTRVISPSAEKLDDASHSITTSMEPNYTRNIDVNANIDNETTDAAPFPSIGDASSESDKRMQDVTMEPYRTDDISTVTPNFNTEIVDRDPAIIGKTEPTVTGELKPTVPDEIGLSTNDALLEPDEETDNATTDKYKYDDDSTVELRNYKTEMVDTTPTVIDELESFSRSRTLSKLDEEIQDSNTERYGNDDGRTVTTLNPNTEATDRLSTSIVTDTPEFTSDLNKEDIKTPTTDAILPPDAVDNIDQPARMEELSTRSSVDDSEISDINPSKPYETESVSMRYLPGNTDNIDSIPMTTSIYLEDTASTTPTQDSTAEQYENDEDRTVTISNPNTEAIDQYSTPIVTDIPEFTSDLNKEDIKTPTTDAILPPDAVDNVGQPTRTEELSTRTSVDDSEISDINPSKPYETGSVSMRYLPENTDNIDSIPMTTSIYLEDTASTTPTQDSTAEQYENDDDRTVTISNPNIEAIDQYSTPIAIDIPESTSDPSSEDIITPTTDAILPPDAVDNVGQPTRTEELSTRSSVDDSEISDINSSKPYETESVSMRYLPGNTDNIDSIPMTTSIYLEDTASTTPTQDSTAEQYENDEDRTVTTSNPNIEAIDQYSTPIAIDIPESTSDPSSEDIKTPTTDAILPPDAVENVDQPTRTEELSTRSSVDDSEISDINPSKPYETGSVSMRYLPENTDNIDSIPMTTSIYLEDIASTTPTQDSTAEQYENDEDRTVTISNPNIEAIDQYSTPIAIDIPESTSDPSSEDIKTPMIDAILPPDAVDNVDQPTRTEELSTKSSIDDSEISDINSSKPYETESVSMRYLPGNTDNIDSIPMTTSIYLEDTASTTPTQDSTAEQYENDDDRTVTTSNPNTKAIDQYSTPIAIDIPESTSDPSSEDIITPTTDAILPPDAVDNIDQPTRTEELSTRSSVDDSEISDINPSKPYETESVSMRYMPENTDNLNSIPTTMSVLNQESTTSIIPTQDSSTAFSDADPVTQNDENNTEVSPFDASLTE